MVTPDVFFKNLKEVYSVAFDNFKLVSQQQKKFVEFWLSQQPDPFKENMTKAFEEWYTNIDKAMNDFKDIVIKGLDYIEDITKKSTNK